MQGEGKKKAWLTLIKHHRLLGKRRQVSAKNKETPMKIWLNRKLQQ